MDLITDDMINSPDLMEKKNALDFIIDVMQYLISTGEDSRDKQYAALSKSVNGATNSKCIFKIVR